jgi:FtsP/CotA-like multicopper oxidase with cupredoxin domain
MVLALLPMVFATGASAEVFVQCPGDTNGDGIIDDENDPEFLEHPNAVCMHLWSGDGYVNMANVSETGGTRGRHQYMFGYADATGVPPEDVIEQFVTGAVFPAPLIKLAEGDEFYLSLTNGGMAVRPDLDDPHTVHFHGFPNSSVIFDGVPDNSISIHMGGTLTYYYNILHPGTYIYHCHVEATEHMQMGMIGNLYVTAAQDNLPDGADLNGFTHHTGYRYAYNDGDGSTYYDVDYPLQMTSFDPDFHDASELVQPLPFALMEDTMPMLNGRGYPETIIEMPLANTENGVVSQPDHSVVRATQGEKVLLRISNVSITEYFTFASPMIPMKVVGVGAAHLRGTTGEDLTYMASSVNVAGGDTFDVILDTSNTPPGTYFLYTTNLNYLSNNTEERGGIMTEVVINNP